MLQDFTERSDSWEISWKGAILPGILGSEEKAGGVRLQGGFASICTTKKEAGRSSPEEIPPFKSR